MDVNRSPMFWNSTCLVCGRPRLECAAEPCEAIREAVADGLLEDILRPVERLRLVPVEGQ